MTIDNDCAYTHYCNEYVDGADCCLIDIVLGVSTKKYIPITILSNICEYRPVPNNQYHSNPNDKSCPLILAIVYVQLLT